LHCFGHIHEGWGAERVRWKEDDDIDIDWEKHVERAAWIEVDEEKMNSERAEVVDISGASVSSKRRLIKPARIRSKGPQSDCNPVI
jgi:hypothetical protein